MGKSIQFNSRDNDQRLSITSETISRFLSFRPALTFRAITPCFESKSESDSDSESNSNAKSDVQVVSWTPNGSKFWRCLCYHQTETDGESFLSFISSGETSDLFNNNNIFSLFASRFVFILQPCTISVAVITAFLSYFSYFYGSYGFYTFLDWAFSVGQPLCLGCDKTMDGCVSHVGASPTAKWSTQFGQRGGRDCHIRFRDPNATTNRDRISWDYD